MPGKYDFEQIIINGAWDGRYTFIEPMITREWLLSQPTLRRRTSSSPSRTRRRPYYPTTYTVHVDQQTKDYVIALAGLTIARRPDSLFPPTEENPMSASTESRPPIHGFSHFSATVTDVEASASW